MTVSAIFYKKEPVSEWMTAFGVEKLTQYL